MKLEFNSTPSDPSTSVLDEIISIQKECRKNPLKLEAARVLVLEQMELRGFNRELIRFAKKALNSSTLLAGGSPRKSLSSQQLTRGSSAHHEKRKYEKGVGGRAPSERIAKVRELLNKLMLVKDQDALDILLGVVAAHELDRDAPWTFIVGPPGGGKNEFLNLFQMHPKSLYIDNVTPKTLASGLQEQDAVGGQAPSLLAKFPNSIYLFQDFTTLLSNHHEAKDQIFAQLRQIYDDTYHPRYGTGGELDWKGHISFIAGVTPVIYHQYKMMATLGPRFFMLRLQLPSRGEMVKFARSREDAKELREQLQNSVADLFEFLPSFKPTVPEEYGEWFDALADFVSKARAGIKRNTRGEVEELPEPEVGTRAVLQLLNLSKGIALVNGREVVGVDEKRMVSRYVWDTIPPYRAHILTKLKETNDLRMVDFKQDSTYSDDVLDVALEDLQLLGLIERNDRNSITRVFNLTQDSKKWFDVLAQ